MKHYTSVVQSQTGQLDERAVKQLSNLGTCRVISVFL